MKINIFLSSRFKEFEDLRKYINKKEFKEIGLNIEIIALDKQPLADILSPKIKSIEKVKESNIYILFIGKTYGGIPIDDYVSYTHREYKTAKQLGLPILVFLTDDGEREERIKELIEEIEKNEIYGMINGNVKEDYQLILNSLKETIVKLTSYGIERIKNLNQVNFKFLEKKSNEFIENLGKRYIGNQNSQCNLNISSNYIFKFSYLEKEAIYKKLYELFYKNQFNSLKNLDGFIYYVPSYEDSLRSFKAHLGEDEEFPISKNMLISKSGCQYLVSKIMQWLKKEFNMKLLEDNTKFDIFLNRLKNKLLIIQNQMEIYNELHSFDSDTRIEIGTYQIEKMVLYLNTIENIINFDKSLEYKIFVNKQIFLKGEALTGKTHLFCEVAKERLRNKQPTILFFGHQFKRDKSIIRNMIDLLDIDVSEESFLEGLDGLGKRYNSRVLIMIDAVNETKDNRFWQDEIISFSKKIKKYNNLALALSIRDVEEYKLINTYNENYIKKKFVILEHTGIDPTLEDIKNICKCLGIKIINIPSYIFNLFVNPGIMWMYIEYIKETSNELNIEDVISPIKLFEKIFDMLNKKFNNDYLNGRNEEIVYEALEEIIEVGINEDFKLNLDKRKLRKKLREINEDILDFLISEGVLREEDGKIYFRYQKFENYFIVRFLLERDDEKKILEKLLDIRNEALLEAFVLLLSEKEKEIFDLDNELLNDNKIVKYFIRSLIWRDKTHIFESTKKYLDEIVTYEEYSNEIFEMVLHSSVIPNYPLNINANFLHKILKDLSIVKRDYLWSVFVHNSFENEGNIKKLVEWVLNLDNQNLSFDKEISLLYGVTLSWFFTSSNRKLRDLATKALVKIFVNNLEIIPDLLDKFKDINDLYVLERILAAVYGAVLILRKNKKFYDIALKIFEIVFEDNVIENIMIRDYASLTIDFINKQISLDFDISKAYPHYKSPLPNKFLEFEELEKQYEKYKYIRRIFSSMKTEDMIMYRDFGRYTFQYTIKHFNQKIPYKKWSAKAIEIILTEIIQDDINIFEKAEEKLNASNLDRYNHKIERIGKKYQWLAMYKILAIIADNFKVRDYNCWDKYVDYKGCWQIGIRNIDPSCLIINQTLIQDDYSINFLENLDDKKWLLDKNYLISIKKVIDLDDKIFLKTEFSSQRKVNNKIRDLFYHIDSFIVKKEDLKKFVNWLNENDFWGRGKLPETKDIIEIFLREYPNSKVWEDLKDTIYDGWINEYELKKLPCDILLTSSVNYKKEFISYDYSFENGIDIYLPNSWFIENMNLKHIKEGIWINNEGKEIFIGNNKLMATKKEFFEFLNKNNLNIIWVLWAEKQYRGDNYFGVSDNVGISEILGYGYFENNEFIEKIDIRREK